MFNKRKTLSQRLSAVFSAIVMCLCLPLSGTAKADDVSAPASLEPDRYTISSYNKPNIIRDLDGNYVPSYGYYGYCLDAKVSPPSSSLTGAYQRVRLSELPPYSKHYDRHGTPKPYGDAEKTRLLKLMVYSDQIEQYASTLHGEKMKQYLLDNYDKGYLNIHISIVTTAMKEELKNQTITEAEFKRQLSDNFDNSWEAVLTKSGRPIQLLTWACVYPDEYWETYVRDTSNEDGKTDDYIIQQNKFYSIKESYVDPDTGVPAPTPDPINEEYSLWNTFFVPMINYIDSLDNPFDAGYDAWVYLIDDRSYQNILSSAYIAPADNYKSVYVSKTDIADGREIDGAHIEVYALSDLNNPCDEWDSSASEAHEIRVKTGVIYRMRETVAPDGYFTNTTDIDFRVNDDGTVDVVGAPTVSGTNDTIILIEDTATNIGFSKTDINGKELVGATMQVLDANGAVVEEWISGSDVHYISRLNIDEEYTLRETAAPDGYNLATDITFTIKPDGTVETTGKTTEITDIANNKVTAIIVEDTLTSVKISKRDITGNDELPGAALVVTDQNGNEIDSWTSDDTAHEITGKLNVGEEYTITEASAPEGYTITSDITFTIKEDGSIDTSAPVDTNANGEQIVIVNDRITTFEVSKRAIGGDDELPGAKLRITEEGSDTAVAEWTSTDTPKVITGLKTDTRYVLTETVAPTGYDVASDTIFTIGTNGSVTLIEGGKLVTDNGTDTIIIEDTLLPTATSFDVSKTDISGQIELEGAKLEIIDSKGTTVASWTSTDKPHTVTGLEAGTYTLRETVAPAGYTIASDIEFTLDTDSTVTSAGNVSSSGVLLIKDDLTKISVSKTDISGQNEIPGAKLEVIDAAGNVLESWTSEDKPHEIEGLVIGEQYTLRETVAPTGYAIATDITFTIDNNGRPVSQGNVSDTGVLLVKDDLTEIYVSKVDIADQKELPGALLQVMDSSGNIVESWTSEDKPHKIEGLTTGEKYTLRETVAPEGYDIATDISFTIDKYGKVTTDAKVTTNNTILVEDSRTSSSKTQSSVPTQSGMYSPAPSSTTDTISAPSLVPTITADGKVIDHTMTGTSDSTTSEGKITNEDDITETTEDVGSSAGITDAPAETSSPVSTVIIFAAAAAAAFILLRRKA